MRYESIPRLDREQMLLEFAIGDPEAISIAVLSAALYDQDWRWAQSACLSFLDHPHKWVRLNSSTGLSHIARIHGKLDKEIVVAKLKPLLTDPEIGGEIEYTLSEIEWFLRPDRNKSEPEVSDSGR